MFAWARKREGFSGGRPSARTGSVALLPSDWPKRDPWSCAACHCWRMMDVVSQRTDGSRGAQSERGRHPVILRFPSDPKPSLGGAEPKGEQVFSRPGRRRTASRREIRSARKCVHERSPSLGWSRDLWRRRIEMSCGPFPPPARETTDQLVCWPPRPSANQRRPMKCHAALKGLDDLHAGARLTCTTL